jgi:hypothetical protein
LHSTINKQQSQIFSFIRVVGLHTFNMAAVLDTKFFRGSVGFEWLPVAAGLLILYGPTFFDLAGTHWDRDDYAHGPIILAVIVWLIWDKRQVMLSAPIGTAPVGYFLADIRTTPVRRGPRS